jgi:hypothetical protein
MINKKIVINFAKVQKPLLNSSAEKRGKVSW